MYLCTPCFSSLTKNNMPHLALNNNLYCGELPDDLRDITWVKEMACALYRTTAHVACLFGTSSETEPLIIWGNTCAHPMNFFANATSLPWAPSDLNELIGWAKRDQLSALGFPWASVQPPTACGCTAYELRNWRWRCRWTAANWALECQPHCCLIALKAELLDRPIYMYYPIWALRKGLWLWHCGNPVVFCMAKHNCLEAKKASKEDAEGLEKEILLAVVASVGSSPEISGPLKVCQVFKSWYLLWESKSL